MLEPIGESLLVEKEATSVLDRPAKEYRLFKLGTANI